MLKFDLARKYLVGLLVFTMILGFVITPFGTTKTANAQGAVVNAVGPGTVNLALTTKNPHNTNSGGTNSTAVLKATVHDGSGALVNSATVVFRLLDSTGTVTHNKTSATGATGTCTAGFTSTTPTTYSALAFWDRNGNGVLDADEPYSEEVVSVTFEQPSLEKAQLSVTPTYALNNVTTDTTHTITVCVKDQFGDEISTTTTTQYAENPDSIGVNIAIAITPTNYATPFSASVSTTSTVFTYTSSRTSTTQGTDTIQVTATLTYVVSGETQTVPLSSTVFKEWYVPKLTTVTPTPVEVTKDFETDATCTITVQLFDQKGQPITGTVNFYVDPPWLANPPNATKTGTTATFTYTTLRSDSGDVGDDTITIMAVAGNAIVSSKATVHWTYSQTISDFEVTPTIAKNRIDPLNIQPVEHAITVSALNQYEEDFTGSGTAVIKVSGVNSVSATVPFTGPSFTWTYTSTRVGTDTITVTISPTTYTVTKYWGYEETVVAPGYVDLNATFTVTVYCAPNDKIDLYTWSSPVLSVSTPTNAGPNGYAAFKFQAPPYSAVVNLTFVITPAYPLESPILKTAQIIVQAGGQPPTPPAQVSTIISVKSGWNMVTPGVSSSDSPATIFGTGFMSIWHWNPVTNSYEVPTVLLPGVGYWVKMSVDKTVVVNGNPTASPFTKAVNTGWEQIGNPFETDILWTNVTVTNGSVTKSLVDAKAAGWIGSAYSYNPSTGQYETASYSTGTMYAGKGYWFRVYTPVTLTFTK